MTVTLTRITAALASAALLAGAATPVLAGPKAVLELFTSQGCSSCPAADKLLAEFADRDDILALSFNVDYWDYLGWKDTLASRDNSQRQRDYSLSRGDGEVYTPQAVIDGVNHVAGSERSAIEAALKTNEGTLTVPVNLTATGDAVTVTIGAAAGAMPHATAWLVMYDRKVTVPIERGENSGKTITYSNVVRKLRPIAMWTGAPMSVNLAKSEIEHTRADSCAVLLQTEKKDGLPGAILGAAAMHSAW